MSSSEVDLELILKPGGPLLSGVAACHIFVNSDSDLDQQPKVIMLVGEIHGNQKSGDIDYVSAYLSLLKYNEEVTKFPLDIMLETGNDYVTFSRELDYELGWIHRLRDAFQNCYVFNKWKCQFKHARAHWIEPVFNMPVSTNVIPQSNVIPQWLLDVHNNVPAFINDWYKNERYSKISDKIKTADDLQKIIFENPYIVSQGEQCTINNWRGFIKNHHDNILLENGKLFDSKYKELSGEYWFRKGIFDTHRFSMDVYAFLRMFRAKDNQLKRWIKMRRFENIIFHAGSSHTERVKKLLLGLENWDNEINEINNFKNFKFDQIHQAVYQPIYEPNFKFSVENINSVSCKVDFHKFLETIRSKIPVPTRPLLSPPTDSSVFIRRVKHVEKGGANSNRIRKLKTRRTRRTRRVKPKSVIKKNTRRRRYCYY